MAYHIELAVQRQLRLTSKIKSVNDTNHSEEAVETQQMHKLHSTQQIKLYK